MKKKKKILFGREGSQTSSEKHLASSFPINEISKSISHRGSNTITLPETGLGQRQYISKPNLTHISVP